MRLLRSISAAGEWIKRHQPDLSCHVISFFFGSSAQRANGESWVITLVCGSTLGSLPPYLRTSNCRERSDPCCIISLRLDWKQARPLSIFKGPHVISLEPLVCHEMKTCLEPALSFDHLPSTINLAFSLASLRGGSLICPSAAIVPTSGRGLDARCHVATLPLAACPLPPPPSF